MAAGGGLATLRTNVAGSASTFQGVSRSRIYRDIGTVADGYKSGFLSPFAQPRPNHYPAHRLPILIVYVAYNKRGMSREVVSTEAVTYLF